MGSIATDRTGLTDGYLPLAAFAHLDATAVGLFDIDSGAGVSVPPGARPLSAEHRDALVLVRLHGDPLGVVHLPGPVAPLDTDRLRDIVEQDLRAALEAHVGRYGCAKPNAPLAALAGKHGCAGALAGDGPLPSTAVVVPTAGRAEKLERCLRSILAFCDARVDVLVVDNRPSDESTREIVDRLAADDRRLRYVAEARPGSSVARNRGAVETTSEIIVFTDDDVVVDANWLPRIVAAFDDPSVNVVNGMVLPLELQTPAQKRFELYAGFGKGVARRRYNLTSERADDRLLYPYWGGIFGSGNSMAFRRLDLVAAGGLDPALGAGSRALAGADIEAMSAAILRGGTLVYEPRSICWHEHRRGDDALERQIFNYGAGLSALLTKALLFDTRRFLASALRAPRVLYHLVRARRSPERQSQPRLPRDLARLNARGLRRGPFLYAESRRWVRKLELRDVISADDIRAARIAIAESGLPARATAPAELSGRDASR